MYEEATSSSLLLAGLRKLKEKLESKGVVDVNVTASAGVASDEDVAVAVAADSFLLLLELCELC